jgi:cytochrome b involved in lipid metabolism
VTEHATPENCWVAAFGNVYDLTEYVTSREHPGGQTSLISGCGKEITDSFETIHSAQAKEYLHTYQIGTLKLE